MGQQLHGVQRLTAGPQPGRDQGVAHVAHQHDLVLEALRGVLSLHHIGQGGDWKRRALVVGVEAGAQRGGRIGGNVQASQAHAMGRFRKRLDRLRPQVQTVPRRQQGQRRNGDVAIAHQQGHLPHDAILVRLRHQLAHTGGHRAQRLDGMPGRLGGHGKAAGIRQRAALHKGWERRGRAGGGIAGCQKHIACTLDAGGQPGIGVEGAFSLDRQAHQLGSCRGRIALVGHHLPHLADVGQALVGLPL